MLINNQYNTNCIISTHTEGLYYMSKSRDLPQNAEERNEITGEITATNRIWTPFNFFFPIPDQRCRMTVRGTTPAGGAEKIINGEIGVSTTIEVEANNDKKYEKENNKTIIPCAGGVRAKGIIEKKSTDEIKIELRELNVDGVPSFLTGAVRQFAHLNCKIIKSPDTSVLAGKCRKSALEIITSEMDVALKQTKGPSGNR